MSEHEGDVGTVKSGPYTVAAYAFCTCGWSGDEHPRPGQAVAELAEHLKLLAPTPKDPK